MALALLAGVDNILVSDAVGDNLVRRLAIVSAAVAGDVHSAKLKGTTVARSVNSEPKPDYNSAGMIDAGALKRYVERVCAFMEERAALNLEIKEVYEEAKSAGFVTKHLRQLCREQLMDQAELHDHLEHMDALRHALGQFGTTPLGEAAISANSRSPEKPARKSRANSAIKAAQAHLDAVGEFIEPIGAA